jgi:DNA-binding NarL/FixJ family response regulator
MKNSSFAQGTAIESPSPIRVFIVDDDANMVNATEKIINDTPGAEMVFVGSHHANTSDLSKRVKDSDANVVIVDIVLERGASPDIIKEKNQPSEWNGIGAVRALRDELGERIKIIVWTYWRFRFQHKATAAGADAYYFKNLSNNELRTAIREACSGISTRTSSLPKIIGIELSPRSGAVRLKTDTAESAWVHLESSQLGFLYYLALERLERKPNEPGWLQRASRSGHGGRFKIQKYDVWIKVNEASGYDLLPRKAEVGEIVEVGVLARHRTTINRAVSDHFGAGVEPLIVGPRDGGSYALNPKVSAANVVIS